MKKFVKLCLAGILCLSTAVSSNCRIWAQEDSKITNITAGGKVVVVMNLHQQSMEI